MLMSTPPLFFWSVWTYLSTGQRLLLVALGVFLVYAFRLTITTVSGINKMKAAVLKQHDPNARNTLSVLRKRSRTLRRVIVTAFYLFGIVLFLGLQRAHVTIDTSKIPVGFQVLENFEIDFIFAYNAFLAFLLLHVLSWFNEAWVERCAPQP
jgi:hypothetical protein